MPPNPLGTLGRARHVPDLGTLLRDVRSPIPLQEVARAVNRQQTVIVGGTGYIASNLRLALMARGHGVHMISRQSPSMWPFCGQMTRQWWEVLSSEAGFFEVDNVVQVTGSRFLDRGAVLDAALRQDLYNSRSGATQALARAIARLPMARRPRVLIHASSVDYYPADANAAYDETYDGPVSDSLAGAVAAHQEAIARETIQALGIRVIHLRIGRVLGDDGWIQRIHRFDAPIRGCWTKIGSGDQWFPWIHIADLCNLIAHLLEDSAGDLAGPVNAVAPERVRQRDFAADLADLFRQQHRFYAPALNMSPFVANYLYPYQADQLLQGRDVVPERALNSGFVYRFGNVQAALGSLREFIK